MKAIVLTAALAFVFGQASAYDVTNLNDSGAGSLRDAVAQANANPGPDTITFSVTGTILLTSGALNITAGPLSIVGPGAGSLTINGNANNRIFTIFENVPDICATPNNDFAVSISGLTLTNARRSTDNSGGAIFSEKTLTLSSMVISNSVAKVGGGVAFFSTYTGQTLTIDNTQFIGNSAEQLSTSTSGTSGGGLRVGQRCGGAAPPTTISISRSVFSGNRAVPTTFAATGAGINMDLADADVTIVDSRIVDNVIVAQVPPLPSANNRGAGISIQDALSVTIERTEISGNSSDRNGGFRLVNNSGTTLTTKLINSTISGNVSLIPPAGAGTAMGVSGKVALELHNSTIANNVVVSGTGVGINLSANAGFNPTLNSDSSIVWNPALAADIGLDPSIAASTVPANESLIGVVGAGVTVTGSGNLIGTDPVLAPLAFNGGPTRTHALIASSPALNTGSNGMGLTTDQRGATFPRIALGGIDMGAYEVVLTPLAGDWDGNGTDTIGLHFPTSGVFALKNANAPGAADLFFGYGPIDPSWIALSGDWDGNGTRTPGLYDPATGFFFLRNSSNPGPADLVFGFGPGGSRLVPLSGDWNNDGVDTVGLYDSGTGVFFLRNANSAGIADVVFSFGVGDPDVVPVVGDWDGNGTTTAGLYDTQTSTFFLRNSNSPGPADLAFSFGAASPSYVPIVGNWDGTAGQTIALYDRRTGVFFLRNANSDGAADVVFGFGPGGP